MSAVKDHSSDTSPVLFLNIKGEPLRFFIRPGPTKIQLQPLITRGGGILCRTQESSAVLLADPGEISAAMQSASQFYISTQYIHDCVVQNQQLDIESYRLSNVQPVQTRAASQKQRGDARMSYSTEDDAAIIRFIAKRQHEVKGNRVWQQMERQGITTHSWQSMKNRFLKHLQCKISDKSPVKKPKKIPSNERSPENTFQISPNPHTPKKTPNKTLMTSSSDSDAMQVTPDVLGLTGGRAVDQPPPRSSPRKRNSCQGGVSEKDKLYGQNDIVKETRGDKPGQDAVAEEPPQQQDGEQQDGEQQDGEQQDGEQQDSEQPEVSPKRARGDKDASGENAAERPDDQLMTPCENRPRNPESSERKLGILERAAREFEDSQADGGSQEDRSPSRAASVNTCHSDECQIMAAREMAVRQQEVEAERPGDGEQQAEEPEHPNDGKQQEEEAEHPGNGEQRLLVAQKGGSTQCPADGGSRSTAVAVTSDVHMFLFDQESQEDLIQPSQEEVLSQDLLEAKQHVVQLMQESKKDLVEVMKALLKASGDVSLALTYLRGGYDREVHKPLWTREDDEKLLSSDSSMLTQLQKKYGAEGISKRQAFLKAK